MSKPVTLRELDEIEEMLDQIPPDLLDHLTATPIAQPRLVDTDELFVIDGEDAEDQINPYQMRGHVALVEGDFHSYGGNRTPLKIIVAIPAQDDGDDVKLLDPVDEKLDAQADALLRLLVHAPRMIRRLVDHARTRMPD